MNDGGAVVLQGHRGDRCREAQDGSDRQVDLGQDDNECLSCRQQRGHRGGQADVEQVA